MSNAKDPCIRLQEECQEMADNLTDWIKFQDRYSFRSNKEQIIYFLNRVQEERFR